MHLSLKGFLRTPETHHEAHQSTTSAVLQTAENNLSGSPGKIHHPCPNYQRSTALQNVFRSLAHANCEVRVVVRFSTAKQYSVAAIHKELCAVYGPIVTRK
ncbi:hypothetical protein J6590_048400 [Homalodisca vitripennis]|nr:hypothetical protein J6590_048400 [Homalodisca vitripennis]